MKKDRATRRLEKAERIARQVWAEAGVDRPTEAELAVGILTVLDDVDDLPDPAEGENRKKIRNPP